MRGKQSFYKAFSNDSCDRLKCHIFAGLGLNPDFLRKKRLIFSCFYVLEDAENSVDEDKIKLAKEVEAAAKAEKAKLKKAKKKGKGSEGGAYF